MPVTRVQGAIAEGTVLFVMHIGSHYIALLCMSLLSSLVRGWSKCKNFQFSAGPTFKGEPSFDPLPQIETQMVPTEDDSLFPPTAELTILPASVRVTVWYP